MSHTRNVWLALMTEYYSARVAQDIFRDATKPQVDRDLATVAYGRHCDVIVKLLDELAEQTVLSRIGQFLLRRAA